jgi:hypothetical protein
MTGLGLIMSILVSNINCCGQEDSSSEVRRNAYVSLFCSNLSILPRSNSTSIERQVAHNPLLFIDSKVYPSVFNWEVSCIFDYKYYRY